MKSLFIVSLPRSLSTKCYEIVRQVLGLAQPAWTTAGEIMNLDRFVHYLGPGYDEGRKYTRVDEEPETYSRLRSFLDEATVKQGYIYKDVIQPFVVSDWLSSQNLPVLMIRRPIPDVVYSMTIRQEWHYPARGHDQRHDLVEAMAESLFRAECALLKTKPQVLEFDEWIFDEHYLTTALRRLYPDASVPDISYLSDSFRSDRDTVLRRRGLDEYKALADRVGGVLRQYTENVPQPGTPNR